VYCQDVVGPVDRGMRSAPPRACSRRRQLSAAAGGPVSVLYHQNERSTPPLCGYCTTPRLKLWGAERCASAGARRTLVRGSRLLLTCS
jgi:hypothetical protein